MKCPKCHENIRDNIKYCPRCGYLFASDEVSGYDTVENQLLSIYTDKKLLYQSNFSLGFLLFNFAYAFYRKMYYEGIVAFISTFLLIIFGKNVLMYIVKSMGFYALAIIFTILGCVAINLYYLFNFNNLYIAKSKTRIYRIVQRYSKSDLDTLQKICVKDSRGNLMISIISVIIFVILLITRL